MNFQNFPKISIKIRSLIILFVLLGLLSPNFLIFAETQTLSGSVNLSALVPLIVPPLPPIPPYPPVSLPPLKISDIQVLEITDSSALIYWKTDQPATSQVIYGKTVELEIGTISDASLVGEHRMRLTGLEASTWYLFQIKSRSQPGAEARTGIYNFKTKTDITPPANVSDFTAKPGIREIQLSWKNPPDKDFKGVRIMRSTKYFPLSPEEGDLVYDGPDENYLDKNLTPCVRYYYTAFAYDTSGNFASGAVASAVPLPCLVPPPIPVPPVEIEVLKITDFHFQIAQKTIAILPDPLNVFHFLPGTILHISIETEKLPKVLKTIMVVIGDKSYLLRIGDDENFYQAGIVLPLQEGLQPIYILVLNFKEGTLDKIEGNILIEPFGVVKSQFNNLTSKQLNREVKAAEIEPEPVYLAKVTLYQYDEVSGDWEEFQALKYSQRNPIYSNPEGQYGFLVPRGKYFAQVEKENYEPLKTKEFAIDKNFINQDIILKHLPPVPGLLERIKWQKIGIILLLLVILAYLIWRDIAYLIWRWRWRWQDK